jgi:hypothetical protein
VITHLELLPRLRMRGAIPPLPHTSQWCGVFKHKLRLLGAVLSKAEEQLYLYLLLLLPPLPLISLP